MEQHHCDVFITHAGDQERCFQDFLLQEFNDRYPAVKLFMDEQSLSEGGGVMSEANAALRSALVVVVVLSKELVSREHLMRELRMLLGRMGQDDNRAMLLPVCDNIARDEALRAFDDDPAAQDTIRARLVGNEGDTGPELVRCAVDQAVQHLAPRTTAPPRSRMQELPELLLGVQHSVQKVVDLLLARRMCLLHGIVGVGKTTVAKAVFNELHGRRPAFPCCFVALGPGVSGLIAAQAELLKQLAGWSAAGPLSSLDAGQTELASRLAGSNVLLVLDNVTGRQLAQLLPTNIMALLGQDSMVLVTSREETAADCMRVLDTGPPTAAGAGGSASALKQQLACLPEEDAAQLFCWHAYGRTAPLDESEEELAQLVGSRCGGLAMAVEVVGRHVAAKRGQPGAQKASVAAGLQTEADVDELLPFVYATVRAARLDSCATVFAAVQPGWDALDACHKGALLDIVQLLKGRPWDLVKHYCGEGVLQRLKDLGFVSCLSDQKPVQVHPVIEAFCAAAGRAAQASRVLRGGGWTALATADPSSVVLPTVTRPVHSEDLLQALETAMKLEWSSGSFRLRAMGIKWLALFQATDLVGRLPSSPIIADLQQLTVVVLEGVQLDQLHLDNCSSLRALSIVQCEGLTEVRLSAVTALERLHISGCGKLRAVDLARGVTPEEAQPVERCTPRQPAHHRLTLAALKQLVASKRLLCKNLLCISPRPLQDFRALVEIDISGCPALAKGTEQVLLKLVRLLGAQVRLADVNGVDLMAKRLSGLSLYGSSKSSRRSDSSGGTQPQTKRGRGALKRCCEAAMPPTGWSPGAAQPVPV